jgi:membrane associated rhomboid family serine protease
MTLFFVIITSLISIIAFNNSTLFNKLLLNPYQVFHRKEYYRIISHGFIHADWIHLIVNMIVLYSFGIAIEGFFEQLTFNGLMHFPQLWFTGLYIAGIIFAALPTVYKQKNNWNYNCVGASGAVSAVLFCEIFFAPFGKLYLYAIIPLPGIVFGILYLLYSQYMSRKSNDNINHDAHFAGAAFGFLFPIIINYKFIDIFINQILSLIHK